MVKFFKKIKNIPAVAVIGVILLVNLIMSFGNFIDAWPWLGKYHVTDPDSLLFLRYFEQSLLRGEILKEDSYGSYPNKVPNSFPPFHLNLLVKFAQTFYTFFPDLVEDPDYVIGVLPPLAGWLCGFLIVWFAWKQTSNFPFVALVAFCCSPGLISYMTFSFLRIDYHFLNSFFIQLWLVSASFFCNKQNISSLITGGIVTFLFMATWQGVPLFFLFVCLYAVFLVIINSGISLRFLEYSGYSMLIGVAVSSIFVFKAGFNTFAVHEYGWFHVVTVFSASLFLLIVKKFHESRFFTRFRLIGLLSALCAIAFYTGFSLFYDQLIGGLSFLFAKDPVMASISELQSPINVFNFFRFSAEIFKGTAMFGFGFLLLPIALFCSPPQLFSKGGQIIRDWFVIFLLLGLYSVRYVRWMVFMPALFTAILLFQLFLGLKQKILSSSKNNYFFKLNLAKICLSILPLILFVFLLNYPNFLKTGKINKDEVEVFNWIRINTPETSGYSDVHEPEYGILSFWDEGNRISYYCKRPVLVNNALWGYKKMAAIFSATSESEAYRLARKYKARYIFINSRKITDQYMDVLNMYKNKADADDVIFNYSYNYVPAKKAISKYSDSFHFWLANQAAIKPSGHFNEPASNFRIVYSSKQKDRYTAPRILLYECVSGCEIKGLVDPGSEVLLSIGCSFDKIEQLYKRKQVADENGMVSFRTPYSTSYKKGRVITQSYYKVSYVRNGIQKFAKLTINENQIINGASLNIIDDATIQFDESSENH